MLNSLRRNRYLLAIDFRPLLPNPIEHLLYGIARLVAPVVAIGIGAAVSTGTSGYVVEHLGYATGFFGLAAVGLIGCAVLYWFVPETKPTDNRAARRDSAGKREAAA